MLMDIATASRRRLFWTLQIGGWAALVPFLLTLNLYLGHPPALAILLGVGRQAIGFLLSLGLWRIYRRWTEPDQFPVRRGVLAALLVVATVSIDFVLLELLRVGLHIGFESPPSQIFQVFYSFGRFFPYIGWTVLYFSLRRFLDRRDRDLRLSRAETLAREAELQVLRAQLNPHFLFNALNSIVAEADDNPARVKAITLSLSEMLRFSLSQREHFAPLGQELAAIENYLEVESARFEARLDWRLEVAPDAWAQVVPTALLLPLVENAIKYGLASGPPPLRLRIGADVREDVLVAFAENSGAWVEPQHRSRESTGIGLANLRRRLALLCGPRAQVDVTFPPGHVRVEVQVPLAAAPRS